MILNCIGILYLKNERNDIMQRILNIKEIAEYMGCCVSTIRNLIKNNEFPHCRVGAKYGFILDKVDKWLEENARK